MALVAWLWALCWLALRSCFAGVLRLNPPRQRDGRSASQDDVPVVQANKQRTATRMSAQPASGKCSRKILLFFASLIATLVLSEIALRAFFAKTLAPPSDERSLTYRYDPELGWFPKTNTTRRFTGSRTVTMHHNSKGFRDSEPIQSNKPAIIFLGDSLVWGFDAEEGERFTNKLQARHPEWAVHN